MACYNGYLEQVKEILQNPSIDVNSFKMNNPVKYMTPLMIAIYKHHISIVKELLQHPDIDINKQIESSEIFPTKGETALHIAILFADSEMVKLLLDAGADRTIPDIDGMRPFHYSTTKPNLKYLLTLPFVLNKTMELHIHTKESLSSDLFAHFPGTLKYEFNKDMIISALDSYDLCNTLNSDYIKKALNTVDIVIVLVQNSEVMGICLMDVKDDLIVDVICGHSAYRGIGVFLMGLIKQVARRLKKNIFLCSERSATGFYTKMEFAENYKDNNSWDSRCKSLIPMVYKHKGGKYRTRRSRLLRRH